MKKNVVSTTTLLTHTNTTSPATSSSPTSNYSGGRRGGRGGRRGRHNFGCGRGGGRYHQNTYNNKFLPPLLPTPSSIDNLAQCQICNRLGHTACVCYERGNFAYLAHSVQDSSSGDQQT